VNFSIFAEIVVALLTFNKQWTSSSNSFSTLFGN